MATHFYLSVGDGATSDYVDLSDWLNDASLVISPYVPGARYRTITFAIDRVGATTDAMLTELQAVERKFTQAREAAGDTSAATRVTFGMQPGSATKMIYWDVVDGVTNVPSETITGAHLLDGASWLRNVQVSLLVLPYARGTVVTLQQLIPSGTAFDSSNWTKSELTVTADATTAPDGTTTADKLIATAVNATHTATTANAATVVGQTLYASAYVKAAERNRVQIRIVNNGSTTIANVTFDLTGGAPTVTSGSGTMTAADTAIWSAGSGWYFVVVSVAATTTASKMAVYQITTGTTATFTGNGTDGMYIWGAQLSHVAPVQTRIRLSVPSVAPRTNLTSSTIHLSGIPGDVPALVDWDLTDASTSSTYINSFEFSRHAVNGLAAGAYPAVIAATVGSSGTSTSDSTTYTGNRMSRTVTSTWAEVAKFTTTERGLKDLVLRMRDSAGPAYVAGFSISSARSGGSLPGGAYTYRVVGLDTSGNIVAISKPNWTTILEINGASVTTAVNTLTWATNSTSVTDWRIYWKLDTNPWKYLAKGAGTVNYTHSTESGATTADPPDTLDILPSLVRARIFSGTSSQVLWTSEELTAQVGANQWEGLTLARAVPLPLIGRMETLTDASVTISIEAKQGNGPASTVSIDCLMLMDALTDEGYLLVDRAGTDDLTSLRRWRIDHPRHGSAAVQLLDASTAAVVGVGRVRRGALTALPYPFGNSILINARIGADVLNVSTTKFGVNSVRVTPRFVSIGGAP